MKPNIYFTYLNCKTVEPLALKYFNDYCTRLPHPNDNFSIWLTNFSEKNILYMMICDVWTRLFRKSHPIRYKLNAAMALIECRHQLLENTFYSSEETGILSLCRYIIIYPIIILISLIILTPAKIIYSLRPFSYGENK